MEIVKSQVKLDLVTNEKLENIADMLNFICI
jgi:hypothetical protein